jgi:hypothetical protein
MNSTYYSTIREKSRASYAHMIAKNSVSGPEFPIFPFNSLSNISRLGRVPQFYRDYRPVPITLPQLLLNNDATSMSLSQSASIRPFWGNLKMSSLCLALLPFGSSYTQTGTSSVVELPETIGNSKKVSKPQAAHALRSDQQPLTSVPVLSMGYLCSLFYVLSCLPGYLVVCLFA